MVLHGVCSFAGWLSEFLLLLVLNHQVRTVHTASYWEVLGPTVWLILGHIVLRLSFGAPVSFGRMCDRHLLHYWIFPFRYDVGPLFPHSPLGGLSQLQSSELLFSLSLRWRFAPFELWVNASVSLA